ncbi:hypothetical protein AN958_11318 [Leucoagaricus sp. SymC.cos]|nr:hypothetical protein AN958_11318 [Leucoagaricus sp. SymC.cos]
MPSIASRGAVFVFSPPITEFAHLSTMPLLENSQNMIIQYCQFVDQSHIDHRTFIDQRRIHCTQPPATGGGGRKSALAQSCAQDLGENIVAATFFFSRLNKWNHSGALIPTICYQLAIRSQDYRNLVTDIIAHDPFVLEKSIPHQFKELVIGPLEKLRVRDESIFANHLIVIDGLDEADAVEAQSVIIQTLLSSVYQQSTPFLWAIFSRPESHIEAAFSSNLHDRFIWRLHLPVSTNANKDIRLYLEDAFRTIRTKYRFPTSLIWPPEEAVDQLVGQSAGLFAYPSSAIRYISGDGTNRPGLDERLNAVLNLGKTCTQDSDNPLSHLDALYLLIMSQIPPSVLPITLAILCLRINYTWSVDNQVLIYCSTLRLSLPDFYAAINNLYSVLAVSKSTTDMPLRLSFYHASFGEFLEDVRRSTPMFHIGASDVNRRCIAASAETLNRLSCYKDASELDAILSCPPSPDMQSHWNQSHGHDLFMMATGVLFKFSKFLNPEVSMLTHLSSVNWRFAIHRFLKSSDVATFFQRIPKEWRSKIIRCPHCSPFQFLRQVLSDLKGGKKLNVAGRKRYVLGSKEYRVWLEPDEYGGYDIKEYS